MVGSGGMKFFPMGRSWILVPPPHGKELDSGCIIECDLLVVYGVCVTQKTLIYEEKKLWSDQKQNHHTPSNLGGEPTHMLTSINRLQL